MWFFGRLGFLSHDIHDGPMVGKAPFLEAREKDQANQAARGPASPDPAACGQRDAVAEQPGELDFTRDFTWD